ncbi:MAG: winged helix-turn-helix transcriptional regulator [Anaerolineae bacterium]|nr:winged helix-turn-helix transcriptional regulator [Anaerolineae bacterium]
MLTRELVLAPQVVQVEFALVPALNALNSLHLTGQVERLSGLGEWVTQMAAVWTPAERRLNGLLDSGLALTISDALPMTQYPDFQAFLRDWNSMDPVVLRDRLLDFVLRMPFEFPECWTRDLPVPTASEVLASPQAYVAFMRSFDEMDDLDEAEWVEYGRLMADPPRLQREISAYLSHAWEIGGLREEWARSEPLLTEAVQAYQKQTYRNLTAMEAIRAVTGRDISLFSHWAIARAERAVFVPSPHMGPYLTGMLGEKTLYVMFGARAPQGVSLASPDLSRAELLVRLNALADDTRLHILELLTRSEELCAQEIIEALSLSQSSASRHLSQLSASGFLIERRREVNKCYSLNRERADEVVRALSSFLTLQ